MAKGKPNPFAKAGAKAGKPGDAQAAGKKPPTFFKKGGRTK